MPPLNKTYRIDDGVRRAKAAQIAGQTSIWAVFVGRDEPGRKILVSALLSTKSHIDIREPGELSRWLSIMEGMAEEPDLFPPIVVQASRRGTPIEQVGFLTV